jgi:cytosine/adenosine deaminase-related metal-dependent hydrolase
MPTALTARYVFPVSSPPIENGVVVIDEGRIVSVGHEVPASAQRIDLNELASDRHAVVAIVPGFVNAHTHLEFSDLPTPLGSAGMAFPDWIRAVIGQRAQLSGVDTRQQAIALGLQESLHAGTTTLGDIASSEPVASTYAASPINCVVMREWLGLSDQRVETAREEALRYDTINTLASFGPPTDYHHGFSPHAPYSTHWKIVELLCDSARGNVPVAMHLAESRDELELLKSHSGPFRSLLEELNVWNADAIPHPARPLDYLQRLAQADHSLVIHGNYLADDEVTFIAARADRMTVVYCPRTHAYFRHEMYPLAKMLAAGVNVALGTDSRGSNPDLNLLSEMRHVASNHRQISPATVLQLGTINGAKSLGLEESVGTLEPGKRADLAIVAIANARESDPHRLLLDADMPVVGTYIGGRRVA